MKIFILFAAFCTVIICVGCEIIDDDCPRIKSKQQWQGVAAKKVTNQTLPVHYVIIHHTVSKECESFKDCATIIQNIQSYHMLEREYDDIAYNFMIGSDGNVYEGCGWNKVGNHTHNYNRDAIGIAFIGNFSNKLPPQDAFNALKRLLRCGVNLEVLSSDYKVLAARQVSRTISPGLPIFGEIQEWDNWSEV